jgi:hypothetical protein
MFPISPPGGSTSRRWRSSSERWNLLDEKLSGNLAESSEFHATLGIFYMPQIYGMGPTALLPSEWSRADDFFALKNPTANLGTKGQHATPRPPKPLNFRTWKHTLLYKSYNFSSLLPTNKIMVKVHKIFADNFSLKIAVLLYAPFALRLKMTLRFAHLVYVNFSWYSEKASGFSYSALSQWSFYLRLIVHYEVGNKTLSVCYIKFFSISAKTLITRIIT